VDDGGVHGGSCLTLAILAIQLPRGN